MVAFQRGEVVMVRSPFDGMVERRALGDVLMGRDFPVVWVCTEAEWQRARSEGREPLGIPWPAEDVHQIQNAQV